MLEKIAQGAELTLAEVQAVTSYLESPLMAIP